jgi:hypothetical protein
MLDEFNALPLHEKRRMRDSMRKLFESKGWQYLLTLVGDESRQLALSLGDDPNMQDSQIHFTRGVLRASSELSKMPPRLLSQMDAAITLEESLKARDSAKAE